MILTKHIDPREAPGRDTSAKDTLFVRKLLFDSVIMLPMELLYYCVQKKEQGSPPVSTPFKTHNFDIYLNDDIHIRHHKSALKDIINEWSNIHANSQISLYGQIIPS